MGDPLGLDDLKAPAPPSEHLIKNTFVAYPDMDGGPTKAWMIHNRAEEDVRELFELGFGKRPKEELYDLRIDPHYMNNVVGQPDYESTRKELSEKLFEILIKNDDPRVCEEPCRFEDKPFAGPSTARSVAQYYIYFANLDSEDPRGW